MKKLDIKPSSLDKNAPPDVQVIYRLTGRSERARQPPPSLGDFDSAEAAQAESQKLTKQGVYHSYLTWWRRNGRRVNKWATLQSGKWRYFKISVPYVEGISDTMVKAFLKSAVVNGIGRPGTYTDDNVRVTVDAETNRTELGGVSLRLPPDAAEKARTMSPEQFTALVVQALGNEPDWNNSPMSKSSTP